MLTHSSAHYKDWCRNNNETFTQAKDFIDELVKLPDRICETKDQVKNVYLTTKKRTLFINLGKWKDYLISKNLIELEEADTQAAEVVYSESEESDL